MRLWVRAMDTLEWHALAGMEDYPFFWSPDSRFVAINTAGKLKKVDVAGGPPQTICDVLMAVVGGSWNRDGVIVFGLSTGGIQRVSSAGGAAAPVTAMNAARKDIQHVLPVFLPDGRHFLYLVVSAQENNGIYLGSLDSKPDRQDSTRLVATGLGAGFVPSPDGREGAILFEREGTLLAQRFDLRRLETAGEPEPVAEQLGDYRSYGYFSASENGSLSYRGATSGNTQLTWFDRSGKSLGIVGAPHNFLGVALSPDGTRVATTRIDGNNTDIWLTAVSPASDTRFTFDPAIDQAPIWSPDGNRIAFASNRSGKFDLYQHASNGAGQDELLFKSDQRKFVDDWSRDGRFLLYHAFDPKTQGDLWVLPLGAPPGERKPIPFLRTEFDEPYAKFSPDGHWVAYNSDESGSFEVYVRPFPAPADGGGKWMISQGGGTLPHWRGDGRELFYLTPDGNVMAVTVSASGAAFLPGTPVVLFKGPPGPRPAGWDVTTDGKKFLFPVPAGETAQVPFTVVLNWTSLLKK
jgi:eukaryotic-like serine/threonine-protein kinase